MMRKWFVLVILVSVFLISACAGDSDDLAGKTFDITYPPVLEKDLDNLSKYQSIATLDFSKGNKVSNTMDDTEGTYEINEDVLLINFENKNEKLNVNFNDFKDSTKDFSSYSATIGETELNIEDSDQLKSLLKLSSELSEKAPVEFIEVSHWS